MSKLLVVVGPLLAYALVFAVRTALGRRPNRHGLNVELAVLLSLYFLATAGLGIFWVANQQLPPFDLHYLFGYCTFALVLAHLALNLRIVVAYARKGGARSSPRRGGWALAGRIAAVLAALAVAFYVGVRTGSNKLPWTFEGKADANAAAVEQYHAMSTHSRTSVVLRAPSVAWDLPVATSLDRSGLPRVDLPAPDADRAAARPDHEVLSARVTPRTDRFGAADLSTLLWASAGITDDRGGLALRASASSGALFPTELYVLAFDVDGLPAGTYAYTSEGHALHDLGRPPIAARELGLDPDAPPTLALVATAVFRRTGQKYRDRAYRYVVADAGHVVGNALLAAAELGLATEIVPRFDDARLAGAVGANNVTEGVVALLSMRTGRSSSSPAPALLAPAALASAEDLELGATSLAHLATSLSAAAPLVPTKGEQLALSRPAARSVALFPMVKTRRSLRTFASGPLAEDALSAVLHNAAAVTPVASHGARVHVVVNRVEGVAPGAYRYLPAHHTLELVHPGDLATETGRAGLDQEVIAKAPAVFIVSADRESVRAGGAREYRHVFLEAGIIGARLYLAAEARGRGGCSVGAFYDEETAKVLGVDLDREWPLHFFAMGDRSPE